MYDFGKRTQSKSNSTHRDVPPKLECPDCGESYQLENLSHPRRGCDFRVWYYGTGHIFCLPKKRCPRCAGKVARELTDDRALVNVSDAEAKKRGWIY
jgi:hypothetical protein